MARNRIELLAVQCDEAYRWLRSRLDGLTEQEYWWEPVPGAWTVRPLPEGRWGYDYEVPDPVPAPFTTIAWRIVHLALCKVMYHEYAFGPRELTWWSIETPATMADALAMLERGQSLLASDLSGLGGDPELDEPRMTNWGEAWPTWKVFWTMAWHDAHHGGEIGTLRDLWFHGRKDPSL